MEKVGVMENVSEMEDFIRNLNDFAAPAEKDEAVWWKSSEAEEWWMEYQRTQLDIFELCGEAKVLAVCEKGSAFAIVRVDWLETMIAIINEGRKRELKPGDLLFPADAPQFSVDGVDYVVIHPTAYNMHKMAVTTTLLEQYKS